VTAGLRRFTQPAPEAPAAQPQEPEERCEMCATPVGPEHSHVVDLENRSLQCACRACYLLFTRETAGGGRFRAVPDRVLHDPDRPLSKAEWDGLGIPVSSAFFLRSEAGVAAFYPSPAGATECLLDLEAWAELERAHPLLAGSAPDVEAILVRGLDDRIESYLVPIDACYELVGTVRMYWQGFDGGEEANERIDAFFGRLAERVRVLSADGS
jgi:hypothetical protein